MFHLSTSFDNIFKHILLHHRNKSTRSGIAISDTLADYSFFGSSRCLNVFLSCQYVQNFKMSKEKYNYWWTMNESLKMQHSFVDKKRHNYNPIKHLCNNGTFRENSLQLLTWF